MAQFKLKKGGEEQIMMNGETNDDEKTWLSNKSTEDKVLGTS